MGITGLLPFVKNSCRPANIRDFSGNTVAVDAYSWLHKGAFACAEKLVKGEKTDGYVFYCIKLLNMLLDAGVKPIMVFDGCNLSSKAVTEKKRRDNREKTRQRGKELLCEGKVKEARECFQRCVDVTPEMAREVIEACRRKSIDCIVAPYEADAQLAYLDKIGMVQLIITEDSDLILFGCNNILFKMDNCGGGLLYEKENLPKSFGANASKFSFEKFRYMCILSGCDYLPSLPGIGLAKACKFFNLTTNTDINVVLSKLPSYLKMPKLVVTDEYKESFLKANNTFLHQLAFCPRKKCLVPLNPYPEGVKPDDMEYAGKYLPDDLACQLAMGNINVKTLKNFDAKEFNKSTINDDKSIVWGSNVNNTLARVKKESTAFKFSTPKRKNDLSQKRKCVESEEGAETTLDSTEELFNMYRESDVKKSKLMDSYEEDPIFSIDDISSNDEMNNSLPKTPVSHSSPKPPLKRIIKSRFFSSDSVQSSIGTSPIDNSLSYCPSSKNEDILSSSETVECSVPKNSDKVTDSFTVESSKTNNKENILNRFAKKKPPVYSSPKSVLPEKDLSCLDNQESVSLLDVFSNESSASTATLSSNQKSTKILSETSTADGSIIKIGPRKLFSKQSSDKHITPKISDLQWAKSVSKLPSNISVSSDCNSCDEGFGASPKVEPIVKSPLKEISPYFLNSSNDSACNVSTFENEITILSDCEEADTTKMNSPRSSEKLHSKTITSTNNRLSKCRSIGLSKKKKSNDKVSRKETLLNFNFTRKPVSPIS